MPRAKARPNRLPTICRTLSFKSLRESWIGGCKDLYSSWNSAKNLKFGAPGEIRTPDRLVRSQVLYPAELRARCFGGERGIRTLDEAINPILP